MRRSAVASFVNKPVAIHSVSFALRLAAACAVEPAEAQQATKVPRIGLLDPSTASGSAVLVDAFRQELSKLDGYGLGTEARIPLILLRFLSAIRVEI